MKGKEVRQELQHFLYPNLESDILSLVSLKDLALSPLPWREGEYQEVRSEAIAEAAYYMPILLFLP